MIELSNRIGPIVPERGPGARSFPRGVRPHERHRPLVLINAVGLTGRLLAMAPRLQALAEAGWRRSVREVVPAVTCTAQATLLTGHGPRGARRRRQRLALPRHRRGPLLAAVERPDPGRAALRHRPPPGRGAGPGLPRRPSCSGGSTRGPPSTISVTPKPYYGADGNKAFGIAGTPDGPDRPARTRRSARSRSPPSGARWPGCPAPSGSPAARPRS